MLIVVSILFSVVIIELAVIIWLIISLLHELEKSEHHKRPPQPHTCL